MRSVLQDLRYASRRLWRLPGLTIAVASTLALGIGGAVATFSVVDAAVLRPMPFADPGTLVRLREVTPDGTPFTFSEPDYLELAQRLRTVTAIAAMKPLQLTLTTAGPATRVDAAAVTATLSPMLGVRPLHGRLFNEADERGGVRAPVALISEGLWRRRFGTDPGVAGRVVRLDDAAVTVVGVLPDRGMFPVADVWVPLAASADSDRTDKWLDVVARMAPGRDISAVRRDAAGILSRLAQEHPEARGWSVQVEPFEDWIVGPGLRRMMWVLLGAVALLLALACANVAGLLMTRTPVRRFEMGVRGALGAGRARLVRQLVTENLLLAVLGGGLGLLAAAWTVTALSALLADLLPLGRVARIDVRVLGVTAVLVCGVTLLFGLAPALNAASADVQAALRSGGRGATHRGRRWSNVLVAVQVAMAMVLLAGAALLAGSFVRLSRVDTGFQASGVLAVPLSLPPQRYPEAARSGFFDALQARVSAIPAVEAVGATATNPFRQWGFANDVTPEERAADAPPSGLMQAAWRSVTPGFFRTLRVPIVEGRSFTAADRDGGVRVAIVSRSLARRLWPGAPAVGRRFYWGGLDGTPRTVIGVAGDVRDVRLDAPAQPTVYVPYAQVPMEGMTLLVRTGTANAGIADAIRGAVRELDPALPVDDVQPLEANRRLAVSAPRLRMVMLVCFGVVALVLAAMGLYGVVAFTVAQRAREIAIRVALGARPGQVAGLFFWRGAALAAAGAAAGLFVAWSAAGVLQALLFDTRARDPRAFVLAAGVLILVSVLASYLPARRATELDPISALTRE